MKFLSRLILMCLCFELLVAPIKPEMAMITILKANAAESCSAGMSWSDAANRCLVNASTAQTQRDLEDCAKSSDPKSCYEKNAEKAANEKGSKLTSGDVQAMYKGNSAGLNIAKTTVYALPLMLFGYLMVKKKMFGKNKCLPPSTIAMMAAGVVMLGGEVYGFIKHKSNLKKLDEARKKVMDPEATDNLDQKKVNASKMQSEAFQLLADEQKSVEELAKTKETFYAVAMSAFAASAGIAAYELISINMAQKKLALAVATATTKSSDPKMAASVAQLRVAYTEYTQSDARKKKIADMPDEKVVQKAISMAAKTNEEVKIALTKLEAVGALFPEVATAASNYKNLLVKYECWDVTAPASAPAPQTTVDVNNLKYLIPLIKNLRNAKTISEALALTQEIEQFESGTISSRSDEMFKEDQTLNQFEDTSASFISTFADLTASNIESKYFTENLFAKKESSLFLKLQNELGVPAAYAKEGGGGAGATIMAIVPTAGMLLLSSNALKGKDKTAPSSNSTTNSNTNNSSTTGPDNTANPNQVESNPEVAPTKNKFEKFILTPKFRIAFGAVLGTLTAFMVKEMNSQKKTAKARKETLLSLKADFENTQGMRICTPDERNDQTQPGCYCYTADGTRNTARSNSAVCQNMWNSVSLNGTSYLADTGDGTKVCITQSNAVDESCSCRTSNTCLKASGFNISGISLGTLSSLGSGLSPINTVASGNGASLNTDAVINGAMKLREATDKVLASKDMKNDNAIVKAAEKSLGNFVNASQGSIGAPSARSTPSSLAGFDAKAALEDLQKEVESTKASTASTGTGFDMGQPSEPSLEFGLTEEEAAIQEQQVAEVLNQDMDLGNNDISTSNSNIFELLTHRYQRSGMRRLFDTEGKTQPDAPAETDVNK